MPFLILAGLLASAPTDPGIRLTQLTIRQRVIVRIRTQAMPPVATVWHEHKGPRCVPTGSILGAAVVAPAAVDFILRGGQRVRARFAASCPALDYYSGFYVAPTGDASICSGRDSVRDRAGGECEIGKFRRLSAGR